ncbi:ABC transporter ATP-binding protein [Lactiplantibacillus mudanjiangensis]|uniref:ABC transporter ATP-binding protein [Lactobacillus pentosus] n=1 Tax=Lactiplantibacillus mudanjiangensis TaxID=1296538 RepID=A0A660E4K8_9LACO|nr:ABC transporter ATP-binding protein [Lactiplantibacillus mudanjiangensis]VDG18387.1 ABC transporter ATP-binding protein [Lactobacillus pentosus] [Lactiplantibacillus mudanjiangensis]VDG23743.1 ABC transporter ATP-binding protein [Lactobacillus pentosus] [Lactiplantibacillus mudanjiangensis]VDG29683.1 ABC transporter ATP-binding protein [Lactobacillus pentosus] [Lactiplantibacillus mudanjiangensis]VDG33648.1 ABC transporter ATP-binding protein [Lactobacillus pentosus] [Lactiplantibacillus mud
MIEIHDLTKRYGNKTALDHLTLNIKPGQIFGFLGHNGAGKSTTLKSLVSIINPTSGSIVVDGLNLDQQRQAVKEKISYVPDTPDIFLQLSASEYWDLLAAAYNQSEADIQQRREQLVGLFEMTAHADEPMASFSHGMRQKAILIGALLPDPDIWILDEPMQGLDPQAAFDLKNLMKAHAAKGKTVIFSTHNLDTAQQLCDQLAILKKGQLIYNGSVADLLAAHPQESLETIYLQMAGRPTNDHLVETIEGD